VEPPLLGLGHCRHWHRHCHRHRELGARWLQEEDLLAVDSLESLVLEVSWEQPSFLLQEGDILALVALAQKELSVLLELPSLAVTVAVLA